MYGYVKLRPLMKDSWAEYEDGGNDCGIALRCYFLERVSQFAPVVLRQLARGLECQDYHSLWRFLQSWSKQCHVDTDWFRLSGEFTLNEWARGNQITELVPLGGSPVAITVTVYPQVQSTKAILEQIERACEAAGLVKSETHQTPSTRRRVDWFIQP